MTNEKTIKSQFRRDYSQKLEDIGFIMALGISAKRLEVRLVPKEGASLEEVIKNMKVKILPSTYKGKEVYVRYLGEVKALGNSQVPHYGVEEDRKFYHYGGNRR
jgi:hypothetical protein